MTPAASNTSLNGIGAVAQIDPKVMALIEEGRYYRWIARALGISKTPFWRLRKERSRNQRNDRFGAVPN